MHITIKKILVLFVTVALLAPLGDYGHVISETLVYDKFIGPYILKSPLWFMILVGSFAASLGVIARLVKKDKLLPPEKRHNIFAHMVTAMAACLLIYFASSVVPKEHIMLSSMLLISFALLIWGIVDGTSVSFFIGIFAALVGCSAEIILIKLGIYHYDSQISIMWGVPPWLASIFFLLGVSVVKIEEFLEEKFSTASQKTLVSIKKRLA